MRGERKGSRTTLTPSVAKTLIEADGVFGVSVVEQEADPEHAVLELPCEVPSLLDHPRPAGVLGNAGEMDAGAAELNEEEHVEGLDRAVSTVNSSVATIVAAY